MKGLLKNTVFNRKITRAEQLEFSTKIKNRHFQVGAGIYVLVKFQTNLMSVYKKTWLRTHTYTLLLFIGHHPVRGWPNIDQKRIVKKIGHFVSRNKLKNFN